MFIGPLAGHAHRRTIAGARPGFVVIVALTLASESDSTAPSTASSTRIYSGRCRCANGKDLVVLAQTDAAFAAPHEMSYPNYKDFARDTTVFRALAAYVINSMNLSGGGVAPSGSGRRRDTANYFTVLGVKPMLGRLFQPGDDEGEVAHPYIVLSYKFWQSHFGGIPNVVGDTIRLNNHPITIIGVTPPEFHGMDPLLDMDAFTPLNQTWPSFGSSLNDRASSALNVFGILRPGPLARRREASRCTRSRARSRAEYPESNRTSTSCSSGDAHASQHRGLVERAGDRRGVHAARATGAARSPAPM